jgi:hypothetical protein
MIKHLDKIHECQSYFDRVVLTKILKQDNIQANALSRLGSKTDQKIEASAQEVIIIAKPSIVTRQDMMQVDEAMHDPEWATDVIHYLKSGLLPEDKAQSQKVKLQSAQYMIIGGALYRGGYTLPIF